MNCQNPDCRSIGPHEHLAVPDPDNPGHWMTGTRSLASENPESLVLRCGWCDRRVTEQDRGDDWRYWTCGVCGFATPAPTPDNPESLVCPTCEGKQTGSAHLYDPDEYDGPCPECGGTGTRPENTATPTDGYPSVTDEP